MKRTDVAEDADRLAAAKDVMRGLGGICASLETLYYGRCTGRLRNACTKAFSSAVPQNVGLSTEQCAAGIIASLRGILSELEATP